MVMRVAVGCSDELDGALLCLVQQEVLPPEEQRNRKDKAKGETTKT